MSTSNRYQVVVNRKKYPEICNRLDTMDNISEYILSLIIKDFTEKKVVSVIEAHIPAIAERMLLILSKGGSWQDAIKDLPVDLSESLPDFDDNLSDLAGDLFLK